MVLNRGSVTTLVESETGTSPDWDPCSTTRNGPCLGLSSVPTDTGRTTRYVTPCLLRATSPLSGQESTGVRDGTHGDSNETGVRDGTRGDSSGVGRSETDRTDKQNHIVLMVSGPPHLCSLYIESVKPSALQVLLPRPSDTDHSRRKVSVTEERPTRETPSPPEKRFPWSG